MYRDREKSVAQRSIENNTFQRLIAAERAPWAL
jgi:hypothetical protein